MSITRNELFQVWRNADKVCERNTSVITHVFASMGQIIVDNSEKCKKVKQIVRNLCSKFNERWIAAKRTVEVFQRRNQEWLNRNIVFPMEDEPQPGPSRSRSRSRGRPNKTFSESSDQSQVCKVTNLVQNQTKDELLVAARVSLYKSGKRDAAHILQDIDKSPTRASKMRRAIFCPPAPPIPYSPEEALSLYVDGRYTKNSYMLMQSGAKSRNANIYPPYNVLREAKNRCYPEGSAISVTDLSAEVRLQSLVDHTARRIVAVQKEVIMKAVNDSSTRNVTMSYKWGCDGSAEHSTYKQKFSESGESKTDAYLYAVCLVPLQLKVGDIVAWQNPRPSSTRFCRPIKLVFEKETVALIKKEVDCMKQQIQNIVATKIDALDVNVDHKFYLTMIDGKAFSAISDSSTQSCAICGATPKVMNHPEKLANLKPNESMYEYGLSTLHAWIRCFECLLHIAYRLDSKKWQIRSAEDKITFEQRKKKIIDDLKLKMHLLVDIPKPGFGTTNDGNTARYFFSNPSLAASITGIDERLIKNLSIILRTMACGYAINTSAFKQFTEETSKLYFDLYPWYNMPSSLHKILIHGADIIKFAALPIGMLSEEAMESRNKDFRNYREFHTRKMSREKTMQDLLNTLLYSSDPVISSISRTASINHRPTESLTNDVRRLLLDPMIPQQRTQDSGSESE